MHAKLLVSYCLEAFGELYLVVLARACEDLVGRHVFFAQVKLHVILLFYFFLEELACEMLSHYKVNKNLGLDVKIFCLV